LAIPPLERERPKQITEVVAAEFVKLGKPFDPRKLPQRKVPPVVKRKVDGVAYTPDAKEQPEKKEEKEKPREFKESALDNLIDRTKEFAEDVPEREEEGDPNGLREGTATEAREGNIYQGQLVLFFRRNFTVNNMVADPDKLAAFAGVEVSADGHLLDVSIVRSSGDPSFDNDVISSVRALMESGATIPEPPPTLAGNYYGKTISVRFSGKDLR
jgi:colicin import membrane protein